MIIFKKITNYFLYKIYKKLRITKKNFFYITFSGGVDSKLLKNLTINFLNKKKIWIIHINHNNNLLDKKYKKKCKKIFFDLKLKSIILNLKKKKKIKRWGEECYLRYKRIKKLKKLMEKNKIKNIWTAENLDDKKENYFISFIRKKKNKKNFLKINKIKPFKNIKKNYIKEYSIKKLKWFEDQSNIKTKYIRNKIRIKLIPIFNKTLKFKKN